MFPLLSAKKFNVALFASGDEKSGVGSVSALAALPPVPTWGSSGRTGRGRATRSPARAGPGWPRRNEPRSAASMGVASVLHRRVPRHHHHRVEVELDPAPVTGAGVGRLLPAEAGDVLRLAARRVPLEEQVAQVDLGRDPELAVRVHLRTDVVEADVAVVQRIGVRVLPGRRELSAHRPAREEVADAVVRVARDVGALRVAVCARDRGDVALVHELERVHVAEGLAHRAGGEALPGSDALALQAVLDRMAELVREDGDVVVAVDARGVERTRKRLPEEHVGRRVLSVGTGAHVRVVACTVVRRTAADRGVLGLAHDGVVAERSGRRTARRRRRVDRVDAVVVLLGVPVALVPAEVVRVVV